MRGIKTIITLLTLLVTTTAAAMTDTYLQAVQKAQKGSHIKAASLFHSQLEVFKDNPTYLNRTRIWLALSLLAEDDHSSEAERVLQTVLCTTKTTQKYIKETKDCLSGSAWSATAQIDADMVSAAVAAYASIQWRRGEYKTSIQLLNFALQHALDAKPMESNTNHVLKQLDATQPTNPINIIKKEQYRQALIQDQLAEQLKNKFIASKGQFDPETLAIDPEAQQALAASVMSEMFAQQMMPSRDTVRQARRDGQQLARTVASEPQIFYRLAASTMCQPLDTPADSALNIESAFQSFITSMASMLEASRGQYIQSFKISQRPVLKSLNIFLDNKQKLPSGFNLFARERSNFLQKLGRCSDSLNLEESFDKALMVALNRPARTHRNEQYLQLLISTANRLREGRQSTPPSEFIQEIMDHQTLANFYLHSHQPEKAIPELQQALKKYKFTKQFTPSPSISYFPLHMAVRNLRNLIKAYQQENKNLSEMELTLQSLHEDKNTLHTEIANQLNMSQEQLLTLQMEDARQALNEQFSSKEMQDMFQTIASIIPQSAKDSDNANPMVKLNQLIAKVNSDDFNTEIMNQYQALSKQDSMPTQQDVFGGSLERKHQFHNSHIQLLLLFTQIELDLNKPHAARQKMREAETYLQTHSGWISTRNKAYHQFTLARLLVMENKFTKASQAFAEAINGWYFTPYSIMEKIFSLLEHETEILEHAVAFSISQGRTEKALNYLELARETNWKSGQLYGVLSDEELIAKDKSLQQQARNLEKTAALRARERNETREFKSALKKATISSQQSHRKKLDPAYNLLIQSEFLIPWLDSNDLGQFVGNILQQISRKQAINLKRERFTFLYQQQDITAPGVNYPPPASHMGSSMTLSTRIQQKISDDTLLISIWVERDTSYVVALDKTDIRAHQQPSPPLLKLVNAFNKSYKRQHGYKLFQTLLAPYLNRPYARIVLITNGPLQNTAFAALSTDPNNQKWLGDRYLLRSLPRAAQMLNSDKPKLNPAKVLVLNGSSVPGETKLAATEIDSIFENFTGNQITDDKLTKKNLMEQLPQYPIVHFAGHSEINHEFPDFSHLALYNDKAYLLELEQLRLEKVRLIVLGSCESAAYADSGLNNQFSSLQESLLSAGADSVLANLFPVNDQIASELLSRFYELLAQGLAKDRALQQAQQLVRANNPNPKDWAGFVLSGSKLAL